MDDFNMDEMPDIYTLSDDEGNEYTFQVLDEAELNDNYYVALVPVYDDPQDAVDDSDPLVIMKQVTEGDEQFFEEIEDDEEFSQVADFFTNRINEIFDVEE